MKRMKSHKFRIVTPLAVIMLLAVIMVFGSFKPERTLFGDYNFSVSLTDHFQKQIYEKVDVMPAYPGGNEALINFIAANIKYPAEAKNKNIQGIVIIRFCVSDLGKVENIKVEKGVDKELDEEAARVVALLDGWTPGKLNGKDVSVWFSLPVSFKLK